MAIAIDKLDPKDYIIVKGAKVNNLKSLNVAIPRNQLVVVTGVSGSGKSSLAFDTLFAEGQRMYVESLSSYARQFLGRMEKPEVEYIKGVCPAIAVEQKVTTKNPRSTVGTTTEIYDYLKLLFARVGKTYSPVSGEVVTKTSVTEIVDFLYTYEEGTRFMILCPLHVQEGRKFETELQILLQKGFSRVMFQGETAFIEDLIERKTEINKLDLSLEENRVEILIDRDSVQKDDEDRKFRMADSIQTALFEGQGDCVIEIIDKDRNVTRKNFTERFEKDGITFEEPTVNFFSFNNPFGACKRCEGFGKILGIDHDLVIPNKSLSVFEGVIAPWSTESMRNRWLTPLLRSAYKFDFPVHRSYEELSDEEKLLLWEGNEYFEGINAFFNHLESKTHKIQYRVLLSKYRGRTECPDCRGTRLRKDAGFVKIGGKNLQDIVLMPISDLIPFFNGLELREHEQKVAQRILIEVQNRLGYMDKVGLGYLTLNRLTSTLSGGEYQRIKLATSLGSALVGSMYILDEPSIGLHPRDTANLIKVLEELRNLGNTVIVVEHEEDVMKSADQIIDIGPDAGVHGGELIFQGDMDTLKKNPEVSHTSKYLTGIEKIAIPSTRRKWVEYIELVGARENNLKGVSVKFPLNTVTCVTGVSGSGKSTLIRKCLQPALQRKLGDFNDEVGKLDAIQGNWKSITQIQFVDQNPIGKSSRSNPVTYVKAYDAIRELYSAQPLAKQRGYKPAFFSFNIDGGRCEACQGEGVTKIEMQFMADIYLPCESCDGSRFKNEILDIKYNDKNISEVLELSIDEAMDFFVDHKKITDRLKALQEVGLGYVRLGQSSNTLSGGEAQRVKLASYLVKGTLKRADRVLFVFDEPTTGLHFHDINKLMKSINALVENGHSVIIIEHNTEVIKAADWVIDLGPEGGQNGGYVVFEGTPEQLADSGKGYTAAYLKEKLEE